MTIIRAIGGALAGLLMLAATASLAQVPPTYKPCDGTVAGCPLVGANNPVPSKSIPNGATTTVTTAAPTALTFGSLLAANSARKSCTIQNTGLTLSYIRPSTSGGATTGNSYQISAGGTFSCVSGNTVLTDAVTGTCASGTCAFVISEQ